MDKKQIQRENLKNILYSIFDNYGDLSKKIYIVISDVENNKQKYTIIYQKNISWL